MFTVDVFPALNASNRDVYRIEIVLEEVNAGLWDETDEIGGRLRYRLLRSTREAAELTATELVAMRLNADVVIDAYAQEQTPVPEASMADSPPPIPLSARAA